MNYTDKATELLKKAIKSEVAEMSLKKLPINGYNALRSAICRQKKLIVPEIAERIAVTKIRYRLHVICLPKKPNFVTVACASVIPKPIIRVRLNPGKNIHGAKRIAFNEFRYSASWIQICLNDECVAFRNKTNGRWDKHWDSL